MGVAYPTRRGVESAAGRAQRPHVLVVEDDHDLRQCLEEVLREAGYDVESAPDGAVGLDHLRRHETDVVVFDLAMPVMDGWHFRVEQRRDPRLSSIPAIAISASGAAVASAVDADVFLNKPFPVQALVEAIDDVLAARARLIDQERTVHRERLAALGTLAAGLAHEINNPLTYVLLNLESLAQRLARGLPLDPDETKELVAQSLDGAERIRRIVASARILATSVPPSRGPTDVNAIVRSALALMREGIRGRAALVEAYGDVPAVLADDRELGQVFVNLLTNASQAIDDARRDHHELRITTATTADGCAVVEIADTGAGIPEYLLPRVFEPFFTTKAAGRGTGLGLSICHGIVKKLGGEIEIESALGIGTTVRVTLPPARVA
jgi:signal transduction histidine kinase